METAENTIAKKSINTTKLLSQFAMPIVLGALIILFAILSDAFLTSRNIINIFRQVSIVGICAVGMTFVILTGGIDLSVGSVIAVGVVSCSKLMVAGVHPLLACLISLVIGLIIGVIIGVFINEVGIPPLIATLAFMTALRGVAYIITGGLPVYGFPESFAFIGQGYVGFVPVPVIIMILVFIGGYILLNKTRFGRYVYGIGGNEEATRLSGINVKWAKYKIYVIEALLATLAGIVLLSRVNSGQPNAGEGYEMDIITAVVLGGVSIAGGSGKITGVITGVFLMGVLTNGMIMINVNEYIQFIVKGLVLVLAVSLDQLAHRKKD